nr:putative reverse transcriptase domain-containing protein [Tanacetum cinerariifolium]
MTQKHGVLYHVSNLKKCHADEPLAVPLDGLHFDDKLHFVEELVKIVDREIKWLKRSRIPLVKVRWNSKRGPEFTWEREDQFRKKYPHLFAKTVSSSSELRENTFNGIDNEDANEHIDKVLEILDLFHKPDVNEDQLYLIEASPLGSLKTGFLHKEMNRLSELVHYVRVNCELCHGSHLSKDFLNKKQGKEYGEVYYGEFYLSSYPNRGRYKANTPGVYPIKLFSRLSSLKGSKMGEVDIDTLTMKYSLALTRGNQGRGMVKHATRNNVNFEIKSKFIREYNRSDKGYHEVPPPLTGNYMPPKCDLRLIDEYFESESVDVSTVSSSDVQTIKTVDHKGVISTEEPKPARKNSFGPLIIEDWHSNDESKDELSPAVNTAKGKVVVNAVKGNGFNAFKASASWEWRQKKNVLDHVSKHNNALMTLERLYYIDAQGRSKSIMDEYQVYGRIVGIKRLLSAVKVTAAGYGFYCWSSRSIQIRNHNAREHVGTVLYIASLFNKPRVTHDAVILYVFPITLIGAAKIWFDRIPSRTINKRTSGGSLDGIVIITNKLDSLVKDMKKLKEKMHAIQVSCEICEVSHLHKDCPPKKKLRELRKSSMVSLEDPFQTMVEMELDNDAQSDEISSKETKEFHEVSIIFYHNVQLSKKKNEAPTRFLPSQLPPKELSLGSFTLPYTIGSLDMYALADLGEDLYSYDSPLCLELKKYNHLYDTNENNKDTFVCDDNVQELITRCKGKTMMAKPGMTTYRLHSCRPIQIMGNYTCSFWPTCEPSLKECNRGDLIFGMDEHGVLTNWYCYCDKERQNIKGKGMLFFDFLLIRYENNKIDDTTREMRYDELFPINKRHLSYRSTSRLYPGNYVLALPDHHENPTLSIKSYLPNVSQENLHKPRPWDFSVKDWLMVKIGHMIVDKSEKNVVFKEWVMDSFELDSNSSVHGGTMYSRHDQIFQEEEQWEYGVDKIYYDPPKLRMETFEVKRYSFDNGKSFVCVTKMLNDDTRSGWVNGCRKHINDDPVASGAQTW